MTYTNFLNVFQRTKTCNDLRFVYEGNPQNRTSFWTANSAAFYNRICTVTCKRFVQIKNSSVHITFVRTRVNGSKRGLVILLSVYNEIWKSVNAWKVLSLVFAPFFTLKFFQKTQREGETEYNCEWSASFSLPSWTMLYHAVRENEMETERSLPSLFLEMEPN